MENNIGSKRAVEYLKKQLGKEEYVGSMLFVGKNENKKIEEALDFARAILCLRSGSKACDTCPECILSSKMSHPDLLMIDTKESIKISDIRVVREYLSLKPFRSKHKIVIINKSDRITHEGANAFLKVLEEPLKDSIIILLAPKKDLLMETIVSRTQVIDFGSENIAGGFRDTLGYDIHNPSVEKFFQIAENNLTLHDALVVVSDVESELRYTLISSINDIPKEKKIIISLERVSEARNYLRAKITPRNVLENMFINMV